MRTAKVRVRHDLGGGTVLELETEVVVDSGDTIDDVVESAGVAGEEAGRWLTAFTAGVVAGTATE